MIDNALKGMVEELIEGNLLIANPIFDRLQELQDRRISDFLISLENMNTSWQKQKERIENRKNQTEEAKVYHLSEARFNTWAEFAYNVSKMFEMEINGLPDFVFLKTLNKDLDPKKQAERLENSINEEDQEYGEDAMPGYASASIRPSRSLKGRRL